MPYGDGATARASSRRARRATATRARDNSNNWTTTHGRRHGLMDMAQHDHCSVRLALPQM
eukprot:7088176-Prymnesium_polylepis.1